MSQQEAVPNDGFRMEVGSSDPATVEALFAQREPDIADALSLVIDAMTAGLLPQPQQRTLWEAFHPAVRREVIAREGSLDTVSLSTFKQQMTMVNNIMSHLFTPDGMPTDPGDNVTIGMSHKDAMNLWLKLNQMMTRDLPKIITMERVQRLENALTQVMEETMTEAQQALVLEKLERD